MDGLLSGKLGYVFYVSVVDATLLSIVVLLWFRHSVQGLMRRGAKHADHASVSTSVEHAEQAALDPQTPPAKLLLAMFESSDPGTSVESAATQRQPFRRRLVIAYALGAAAYSLVMTSLQFADQEPSLPFVAWVARAWINAWPLIPSLVALLVADRRSMFRLALCYLVIGLVAEFAFTLGGQVLRGTLNSAPVTNLFWMVAGLALALYVPLALIVVSGWRRIRSVMPIGLAGVIVFGFALLAFGDAMTVWLDSERIRSMMVSASSMSSVRIVYYGLFLLVSLPVGWIALQLLRGIAAGFERKRFSDVQLIVDCWWMIVAAEQATLLSTTRGYGGIVGALAAFAAYRIVVALALRSPPAGGSQRRLLLLRVFGYQRRTESLFDRVAQAWRFDGPVQLIAGVDLASRTATPGAILRLLSGTLRTQYIAHTDDIAPRVAELDAARDRDGRFRVNNVYCRDDTWRATLTALLDASDCVLMDLRGFSAQNQGCVFELEQLLLRVPAESIVLIVDNGTDLPLLAATLERSWNLVCGTESVKRDAILSLVSMAQDRHSDTRFLMRMLTGDGKPDRLIDARELARGM